MACAAHKPRQVLESMGSSAFSVTSTSIVPGHFLLLTIASHEPASRRMARVAGPMGAGAASSGTTAATTLLRPEAELRGTSGGGDDGICDAEFTRAATTSSTSSVRRLVGKATAHGPGR